MEPMEEAVYLDQVKVLAVDHPEILKSGRTSISPATHPFRHFA